jgi:hypothetical protein
LPVCFLTPPPSPHNTSTMFVVLIEGDVTCIDTFVSLCYILQVLIICAASTKTDWPSEGTEEMQLIYDKASPMILVMEVATQLSFDTNCDLRQPNLQLNIPLRL